MLHTPDSFLTLLEPQASTRQHAFIFRGGELLVRDADLALPEALPDNMLTVMNGQLHPVGLLEDRYCQAAWVDASVQAPPGYVFRPLRSLFGEIDDGLLGVAGRAFQIVEWARTHRYCGVCGTPTEATPGERCMRCPACGYSAYPRISPAMMVLVRRGPEILLARHAGPRSVRYSALAGFLEAGESIEEAVHREVREEVGLEVTDLKYFGSQSWPFPHSLMIAFTAEYASGEIRLQEEEIIEARWFGPGDDRPPTAPGISIAAALIDANWPGKAT